MHLLLVKYGYLLLFFGVALEGEAFLLAGAFLANRGYFDLSTVAAVSLAANTLGTQFYYMAARVRGRRWFENRFRGRPRYRKILDWVNTHGNWLLVVSRFAFGFRIVIPAACGAFGMPMMRFTVLNVAAGVLWVVPTIAIGFYFGASVDAFVRDAGDYAGAIVLGGLLAAAVVLGIRHLRRVRSIFQHLEWSDLHSLIPSVMGFMGAVNIVAAIWPASERLLREIRAWLPLEVSQQSRILMLFTGIALLQVTRDLARRKELAWYIAVIALSSSLLLHVTSGLDVQNSLIAALLLAYLLYFRRRFYTRSDPASLRRGLTAAPLLLLIVFLYGLAGFYATEEQFIWSPMASPATEAIRAAILISSPSVFPASRYAERFLRSVQIAGWIARIYILVLILRPVILRDRLEAPKEEIDRIFREHGKHSLAPFAIQPDKHHLLVADRQGLVAYASKGAIAVACGDPLAPSESFESAVSDYVEHCRRHGWLPCVYMASEECLSVYQRFKLHCRKIAEEALIDLNAFAPALASPYASAVHRYDRYRSVDPLIDEQLEEISEDWLEKRHMREMGFTAGHFSLQSIEGGPVFILGNRHYVEAFCAWLTYDNGQAVVLDLVRQRREASEDTVHVLLVQSLSMLKGEFKQASIFTEALPRHHIEAFNPQWQSRYLVHPRGANVPRLIMTLTEIQER